MSGEINLNDDEDLPFIAEKEQVSEEEARQSIIDTATCSFCECSGKIKSGEFEIHKDWGKIPIMIECPVCHGKTMPEFEYEYYDHDFAQIPLNWGPVVKFRKYYIDHVRELKNHDVNAIITTFRGTSDAVHFYGRFELKWYEYIPGYHSFDKPHIKTDIKITKTANELDCEYYNQKSIISQELKVGDRTSHFLQLIDLKERMREEFKRLFGYSDKFEFFWLNRLNNREYTSDDFYDGDR
jgi:hypothetical protein